MEEHLDHIGQMMGDYRLLRWLGGGSFGNVYLAEHLHEPRQAAVKVLDVRLTRSDDLKTFLNEARTMRLRHPHIVPLLDFGLSEQELPFLVMEYESLGSIRDRYPRGTRLPLSTVLLYTRQIASALAYAHEQRLVHRDVKPENMLVRDDQTILLSDFGVASVAHSSHSLSLYQGFGGTVPYAAPEQMQGKPRPASDQYSLAVVVYEWLAGRRPFEGTAVEVAMQHVMTPPPSLLRQVPTLQPGVEQVIFTALAKDPKERFSSVWDFAQALQGASRQSRPISSTVTTRPDMQMPPLPHPALLTSPRKTPLYQPASLPLNGGIEPLQAARSPSPVNLMSPVSRAWATGMAAGQQKTTPPVTSRAAAAFPTPHAAPGGRLRPPPALLFVGLVVLLIAVSSGLLFYRPILLHSASSPSVPAATRAAQDYENGIAHQGIMFGFDAAHTHWNPYEKLINASNVSQLKPSWSYFFGDAIDASPTVANGVIYIGSRNSNFYALDASCRHYCSPLWAYTAGYAIDSSAAVANGMVYVGSQDRKLYAFDARCRQDCQPLWTYTTGGSIYSSPTVADGVVYIGSSDHKLYAFDAQCKQACQPLWSYATGDQILTSAAVANGIVYIGSGDRNLYAFDARCRHTCQPLWSHTTGGYEIFSSPVVANGLVYIASLDHKLYAFDARCRQACSPLWTYTASDSIDSSPAVANGIVYVGSRDGKLYAFDAQCRLACQPLWTYATGGYLYSSPTVANSVVYVASARLYAFDARCRQACQPLWAYTAGYAIDSSPTVANGVVYVTSYEKLYAFRLAA